MTPDAHLTEEQLILYHYDEDGGSSTGRHLGVCDACRAEYDELAADIAMMDAAPVPERGEEYGEEVWHRLAPRLPGSRASAHSHWWMSRPLALAATIVVMLMAAFLVGRWTQPPDAPQPISEQIRERILLVAVGEHLERSQMMLIDLVNANGTSAPGDSIDISGRQERAEKLLTDSRIYRRTAAASGDAALAWLLDELERVMLDIAHRPPEVTHAELEQIQKRIEEQGILLRVRAFGTRLKQREETTTASSSAGRT